MSMSKQDFIALADSISEHNRYSKHTGSRLTAFTEDQLNTLAAFCRGQNSSFMRDRWLGYIAGKNTANGRDLTPKPPRLKRQLKASLAKDDDSADGDARHLDNVVMIVPGSA